MNNDERESNMISKLKVFKRYYISIIVAILLPFCVTMAIWEYQTDIDLKIMANLFAYYFIYLFMFSMLIESLNIGLIKYLFYIPCFLYIFLLSTQYFDYISIGETFSFVKEINYGISIIDIIVCAILIAVLLVCNRGKINNVKYEYPLIVQYIYIIVPFGLFFINLCISLSQSSFGIFAIIFFTPALIISILSQILFYILYLFVNSQNLKFNRNKLKYYYLILIVTMIFSTLYLLTTHNKDDSVYSISSRADWREEKRVGNDKIESEVKVRKSKGSGFGFDFTKEYYEIDVKDYDIIEEFDDWYHMVEFNADKCNICGKIFNLSNFFNYVYHKCLDNLHGDEDVFEFFEKDDPTIDMTLDVGKYKILFKKISFEAYKNDGEINTKEEHLQGYILTKCNQEEYDIFKNEQKDDYQRFKRNRRTEYQYNEFLIKSDVSNYTKFVPIYMQSNNNLKVANAYNWDDAYSSFDHQLAKSIDFNRIHFVSPNHFFDKYIDVKNNIEIKRYSLDSLKDSKPIVFDDCIVRMNGVHQNFINERKQPLNVYDGREYYEFGMKGYALYSIDFP